MRAFVIEEGVRRAGVNHELGGFVMRLQLALVGANRLHRNALIGFAKQPQNRGGHLLRGLIVQLAAPVKHHHRADILAHPGHHQRQPAAHAEADDSCPFGFDKWLGNQIIDRALNILDRPGAVKFHRQLASFVWLGGFPPAIQVWRQRDEALAREAPGDILDVVVQPPPFLNHDDAGKRPRALRPRQVARHEITVARKLDHAHMSTRVLSIQAFHSCFSITYSPYNTVSPK